MGFIEKWAFERGLTDTKFFRNVARRAAYLRNGWDPESVHEMALKKLNEYEDVIIENANLFYHPRLCVRLAGHKVMPFGTAAGLDKNGDALYPLSHVFGFLEPGTVVLKPREGNKRPRMAVDSKNRNVYNAHGFPSKGLDYFLDSVKRYRERGGEAPLLVSICGIPPSADKIDVAYEELSIYNRKNKPLC